MKLLVTNTPAPARLVFLKNFLRSMNYWFFESDPTIYTTLYDLPKCGGKHDAFSIRELLPQIPLIHTDSNSIQLAVENVVEIFCPIPCVLKATALSGSREDSGSWGRSRSFIRPRVVTAPGVLKAPALRRRKLELDQLLYNQHGTLQMSFFYDASRRFRSSQAPK